jgi:N6-L-threonylcarbamoyladenine synthase
MKILAIETSCDDTCAAVLEDTKILSNVISSQTDLYKEWGGVVPNIAKQAHRDRIDIVINKSILKIPITNNQETNNNQFSNSNNQTILDKKMENIDVIAVTQGPGLAVALGVGIDKAKELAKKYNKKLVAVNHIEGHVMSTFFDHEIKFPALCLTASGGHTKIILVNKIGDYKIVGETLDDASGEALDKAAKMMGLGYPGGPIIERLAKGGNEKILELPKVLRDNKILDFSFSGIKTSFYYKIKDLPKSEIAKNIKDYAACFQDSVFEQLERKFRLAIEKYQPKMLLASGGVMCNLELRKRLRKMAREMKLEIAMPYKKELNTDNAAMIGLVAYYKALRGEFVVDIDSLDREARIDL